MLGIFVGHRVMTNDLTVIHPNGIEDAIFEGVFGHHHLLNLALQHAGTQLFFFTRKATMFNTHQFENRWGVEKMNYLFPMSTASVAKNFPFWQCHPMGSMGRLYIYLLNG